MHCTQIVALPWEMSGTGFWGKISTYVYVYLLEPILFDFPSLNVVQKMEGTICGVTSILGLINLMQPFSNKESKRNIAIQHYSISDGPDKLVAEVSCMWAGAGDDDLASRWWGPIPGGCRCWDPHRPIEGSMLLESLVPQCRGCYRSSSTPPWPSWRGGTNPTAANTSVQNFVPE